MAVNRVLDIALADAHRATLFAHGNFARGRAGLKNTESSLVPLLALACQKISRTFECLATA